MKMTRRASDNFCFYGNSRPLAAASPPLMGGVEEEEEEDDVIAATSPIRMVDPHPRRGSLNTYNRQSRSKGIAIPNSQGGDIIVGKWKI